MLWLVVLVAVVAVLIVLGLIDIFQQKHAVRRNYPLVGRLRYLLEKLGPELRQYIVTDNDEERPFTRDQRRWSTRRPSRRTSTSASGPTTRSSHPGIP